MLSRGVEGCLNRVATLNGCVVLMGDGKLFASLIGKE